MIKRKFKLFDLSLYLQKKFSKNKLDKVPNKDLLIYCNKKCHYINFDAAFKKLKRSFFYNHDSINF